MTHKKVVIEAVSAKEPIAEERVAPTKTPAQETTAEVPTFQEFIEPAKQPSLIDTFTQNTKSSITSWCNYFSDHKAATAAAAAVTVGVVAAGVILRKRF